MLFDSSNTFHAIIVNWQEMVSYWLPLPGNKERITRYCVTKVLSL